MVTRKWIAIFIFTGLISLLFTLENGISQVNTLNRDYDPVVVSGMFPDLTGAPMDELFVFRYNKMASSWEMIPFQIDEKDTSGSYFTADQEQGLDANDEISFMARDAGDRADSTWIDDVTSQNFSRYEITVRDTSNGETTGWVYLYRSNTLTLENQTDYVDYVAGPPGNAPADTVKGRTYTLGNSANGLPNFMAIPQTAGGNGQDILDKQSIEIVAIAVIAFTLNETDNLFTDSLVVKNGNIRVIRELLVDITVPLFGTVFNDLPIPVFYYGFSYTISGTFDIPQTGLPVTIPRIQQSYNLNANAVGMKFFSNRNADVDVDGVPDTVDESIVPFPQETTWTMFTGPQGSFVNLFKVPAIGETRNLFYEDDAGNGSYGNAGFVIRSNSHIFGPAPLGLTGIFPSSVAAGEEAALGNQLSMPLDTQSESQEFGAVTSVVARSGGEVPETFTLAQNFPNPFNPSTLIQYTIPANFSSVSKQRTTVTIFNLLGEKIVTLVDKAQTPGSYTVTWDGKDRSGHRVSSGIYVYRLQAGPFSTSKRMVFVK